MKGVFTNVINHWIIVRTLQWEVTKIARDILHVAKSKSRPCMIIQFCQPLMVFVLCPGLDNGYT